MYFALESQIIRGKDNVFTISFHHKQFFGKAFERMADKCCSILKSHRRDSKAHRVINLEMAKILKEKITWSKIVQAMCNRV